MASKISLQNFVGDSPPESRREHQVICRLISFGQGRQDGQPCPHPRTLPDVPLRRSEAYVWTGVISSQRAIHPQGALSENRYTKPSPIHPRFGFGDAEALTENFLPSG
jgi:hypothetical protein